MAEPNLIEHLSGGNHELFHSNMLAYIAQKYPDFFLSLFKPEAGSKLKDYDRGHVRREKNHFDLSITDSKGKYLFVLENKMKSFPDTLQLDNYSKKSKGAIRILLTMISTDEEIDKWHQITYGQLAERMMNNIGRHKFECYFRHLLEDYIEYLCRISEKVNDINIEVDAKAKHWLQKGKKSEDLTWEDKFIQKVRFQLLADEIKKNYNNPLDCGAGIIRGATPYINIWPVLKFDKSEKRTQQLKQWRELTRENKCHQYWCQIYDDHIERGFCVYYDKISENNSDIMQNHPKKSRQAKNRYPFLEQVWNRYIENIPELNEVAEKLDLKTQFENNRKLKGDKALKAYIYSDMVMVYVREDLGEETLNDIIEKISGEINDVYKIMSKTFNN